MHSTPLFLPATPADCEELAAFAAQSFADTFGHLYVPQELADYLVEHYHASHFMEALAAGDTILLRRDKARIIAYAKVGDLKLPVEQPPAGSQEIHRLYIDKDYHGLGLGRALMDSVMALPRLRHAPAIYLCVWEENEKALKLYGSYGFLQIGTYLYRVGSRTDNDLILARYA